MNRDPMQRVIIGSEQGNRVAMANGPRRNRDV